MDNETELMLPARSAKFWGFHRCSLPERHGPRRARALAIRPIGYLQKPLNFLDLEEVLKTILPAPQR